MDEGDDEPDEDEDLAEVGPGVVEALSGQEGDGELSGAEGDEVEEVDQLVRTTPGSSSSRMRAIGFKERSDSPRFSGGSVSGKRFKTQSRLIAAITAEATAR